MKVYLTTSWRPADGSSINFHAWSMKIGSVREFGRDGFKLTAINFSKEMVDWLSNLIGQPIENKPQENVYLEPDDTVIVAHFIPMPGSTDKYTVEFTGMKLMTSEV